MNETAPLLTKLETARRLHISLRHLSYLLSARAIEFVRIGKSVRFSPEAVRRFQESRTVRATA